MDPTWTTWNEIEFLERIECWADSGYHHQSSHVVKLTHRELLEKYKESMKHRKKWGEIDRYKIEDYLEMELAYT